VDANQKFDRESEDLRAKLAEKFMAEEVCDEADLLAAVEGFINGDLTLAQLEGKTNQDLYAIADLGYDLLQEGKYADAEVIFKGLLAYNPRDSYFHALLGSTCQRSGRLADALVSYRQATTLDPTDINSWTNMGEVLLESSAAAIRADDNKGGAEMFTQAVEALGKAISLDKNGRSLAAVRAKALVGVTVGAVQRRHER